MSSPPILFADPLSAIRSKRLVAYQAWMWGCRNIAPRLILFAPKKERILEVIQDLTGNDELVLQAKTAPGEHPAFYYSGKAWNIQLTTKEFQAVAREHYIEVADHSCKSDLGQGLTIFAYRPGKVIDIIEFEEAFIKFLS